MTTRVVNLRKEKYDVYIGRAGQGKDGYFGNPFRLFDYTDIGLNNEREKALIKYTEYFYKRIENDNEFKQRVLALKGKTLGCFCKPKACHGDVIAKFLNNIKD